MTETLLATNIFAAGGVIPGAAITHDRGLITGVGPAHGHSPDANTLVIPALINAHDCDCVLSKFSALPFTSGPMLESVQRFRLNLVPVLKPLRLNAPVTVIVSKPVPAEPVALRSCQL